VDVSSTYQGGVNVRRVMSSGAAPPSPPLSAPRISALHELVDDVVGDRVPVLLGQSGLRPAYDLACAHEGEGDGVFGHLSSGHRPQERPRTKTQAARSCGGSAGADYRSRRPTPIRSPTVSDASFGMARGGCTHRPDLSRLRGRQNDDEQRRFGRLCRGLRRDDQLALGCRGTIEAAAATFYAKEVRPYIAAPSLGQLGAASTRQGGG
jgi:hypothetical protein